MRGKLAITAGIVGLFALLASMAIAWWYWDWGHAPVEKLAHLHGRSMEAVVGELGEPDSRYQFPMSGCAGEFRVELFNTYPPQDPNSAQVQIQELQWHYERYHVAVWFHEPKGKWIVLDTCRWEEGVEF